MNGTGDGRLESNQGQIKIIVRTLAAVLVLCLSGIFTLLYHGKTIPTELWLLTSNNFTALATMLVKTSPTLSSSSAEQKPSGSVTVPEQQLETKS